ncbi:MAG: methyltransferase domain-containing protein, partial [Planctomycetes bacterium]|nr:methyltransferase domain-containing protein [Planctomycetota bacterium]
MKELAAEMDKLNQPMAACLKWQCNAAGLCSMVLAGDVLLAGGQDKVVAIDTATGQVAWEGTVKGKAYGLAVADGRLIVSADSGEIACFERPWLFSRATRKVSPPVRAPSVSDLYATAAATIVEQTGITKGYCLVLNSGEGRLAYELAKRTQLRICAFDSDAKRVESARQMLDAAGLYGARVTVQQCSPDRLPCPDYFANLIVCDKAICLGALPLFGKELLRVLRPCGGVLFIGQPAPTLAPERLRKWLDAHGLSQGEIVQANGLWAKFTRGPLPGSADWTHQYGDAGNTACSDDRLVKCPLGVLWFGDPGPAKLVNRHTKPAAPVAAHGRLFIGGDNVLFALDAYNGFPLWERPIPGARRVGTHFESSHLVATADSVYVSAAEGCLRLDAATGETLATFPPAGEARLYGGKPPSAEGQPRKWGYLAVSGDLLLGSTALEHTLRFLDEDSQMALARKQVPKMVISKLFAITPACFKTREDVERKLASLLTPEDMTKWGALLLQELPMGGVASDGVFALDRRTGARRWSHGIPGGYVAHIAVAAGGGRVYLAQTDDAT